MHTGLEMLIERMKTHPEDFEFNSGSTEWHTKWGYLLNLALQAKYFTDEEKKAVELAKLEAQRDYFTHRVLEVLTLNKVEPIYDAVPEHKVNTLLIKPNLNMNPYLGTTQPPLHHSNPFFASNNTTGQDFVPPQTLYRTTAAAVYPGEGSPND